MSVQLNDRHVNFTGRSGSVAMPHLGLVRFNLSASTIGPQYFTSELCYSDVNCTNLCTDALMGHVRACKVDRAIMPVIIVLFWMVTAVACIGFLAALYLRKLAEQRQKALHQLPEVFGTSPAASRTWRPQQRAPTTPRSLSSSHAVFADDHKASHGGSHEADLEHAFEAPAVIPMQGNDESLTPQLRSTASSATTTSCGLPKREEIEMAALRAVAPPSRQHPSKKHRHTHTHDDEVTGTTTMSLRQARHSGPDLPASTATLDTIILHYSTHTLMLQPDRKNIAYQLNCSAQQQQPKKNRVQALEHAARLRAELEAAEEAARLMAEHEAEQTRVQALEHAARLRAELEAAEEAARLGAEHEAEQTRVQALEHAARLRAELEAAEEAARLGAEHEAEQTRVQALEHAARLRAELEAAEEAARLGAEHEAEQTRVQALEHAARLRAELEAAEEAARLMAEHEAEQTRVQALEHAARLRAELEAAEEAARLGAEHEAEQTRVQALEHAARLRAELEAAEEAARLMAEHEAEQTRVQALEHAARLRAELEAAEEAARLMAEHEAEQTRVQALEHAARLRAELEAAEEAARLMAEHEAEQTRVQALEHAARLRAELEAAEEAARLMAEHEAEQTRVQALEHAARLRAELEAAEEAARLGAEHEAEQTRVQALEHAARLRAELEAAEEAARLGAEHEAEQTRVQALEHAARLRAELEAAEEDEKDVRAATSSYNEEYKERILAKARPDPRMRLPRPFIGLSLLEDVEKGTLIVDGLYRDGPAYQTGIRLGDVLLRIAGVYVDSIAKVRQVVDARCRCGCVVPVTLSTKMNQQYSVALWIMTVDPQHNDKPFFFDVHMHHRIESSQIGKKAPWVEVLESPSVSSAVTPLVPLLREPTPRRGSELRSSARSAFVATSYFSMARRSLSSESEQPRGSSSVATAEEAVEASALAPRGYTPPNNVRRHS
ncbi:viscerotropic leishmaniasis antigen, putative [Leishmania donovani]|uniref:Viscerotropic leishmaniasis antigen, putative n=1 Tax=Leishmania donovani TaxID=5661 RepID=A0A3S5H5G8_LEIDO|nr:viscerotropic leishmaniasis antigen, putative [Leishmania donovani]